MPSKRQLKTATAMSRQQCGGRSRTVAFGSNREITSSSVESRISGVGNNRTITVKRELLIPAQMSLGVTVCLDELDQVRLASQKFGV